MLTMIKIGFSPLGDVMVGDGDHRRAQVPPHRLKIIIMILLNSNNYNDDNNNDDDDDNNNDSPSSENKIMP